MDKSKKSKLWISGGIPGLGKSTWLQNHKDCFDDKVIIISRDKIRFNLLKDNKDYFSKETEVWNEYIKQIKNAINNKIPNIILDATHLNQGSRAKVLLALGKSIKDVNEINVIFFTGSLATALERNEKRSGREYVPPTQIYRMKTSIEIPSSIEKFDHIFLVNIDKSTITERIGE